MNTVADESTNSQTFTDLPTPDRASVTLAAPATVSVLYNATVYKNDCVGSLFNVLTIDGTDQAGSSSQVSVMVNTGATLPTMYTTSLPAGSHTISVRHRVDTCAGHWLNRSLLVLIQ
jgi:hypothetical protein